MTDRIAEFEKSLTALMKAPGREIAGLAVAVSRGEGLIYSRAWGTRDGMRPMTPSTLCRVASISKMAAALTALTLEERGLIDLGADLSGPLGFPLRNPHFPDQPLSGNMLLTHTSSLRDGTVYNLPRDTPIRTLLSGDASLPNWNREAGPGEGLYAYCNLGYGVLATALERVTGKTFDSLVREILLEPLYTVLHGENPLVTRAAFNLQALSASERDNLAVLYRKETPGGPWVAQCDSPERVREICHDPGFYTPYQPGSNGTLYAPQGGMRASVLFLNGMGRLFLGRGSVGGVGLISPTVIDRMTEGRLGIFGVDDFLPGVKGPRFLGHHGDAYGLKGALYFDREEGLTFSYLITGTADDPDRTGGLWSARNRLEETLTRLIIETWWNRDRGDSPAG